MAFSQQYRACWTRRPPVFTNPCCRLVSDQLPIALGSANRRHRARPERSRRVAEVISDHAKPQPHLVGPEAVAAKPRQRGRLLAFLDPLLCGPALVLEPDHRAASCDQIGHDEADPRKELAKVELDPSTSLRAGSSPPPAAAWSNWPLGRRSAWTGPPACGWTFLPAAWATPQSCAPGCHWREGG